MAELLGEEPKEPREPELTTEQAFFLMQLRDRYCGAVDDGQKIVSDARAAAEEEIQDFRAEVAIHDEYELFLSLRKRFAGGSTLSMLRDAYVYGEE